VAVGPRKPAIVRNVIATANVANEGNAPAKENANVAAIVSNFLYITKKLTISNTRSLIINFSTMKVYLTIGKIQVLFFIIPYDHYYQQK